MEADVQELRGDVLTILATFQRGELVKTAEAGSTGELVKSGEVAGGEETSQSPKKTKDKS